MVFFFLLRALFLIYYIPLLKAESIPWQEVVLSFWHALYLDSATTSYLLFIPLIILFIQGNFATPVLNSINNIYTFILVLVTSLVGVAELGIYAEWKTKLNGKALIYLQHPAELYESISGRQFFGFVFALFLTTAIGYFLYKKVFFRPVLQRVKNRIWTIPFLVIGLAILTIGLRGGVGAIPISLGVSYYSKHSILNWAAVNSNYNLTVSYIEGKRYDDKNPFDFYPFEEAKQLVSGLKYVEKDTTTGILNTQRPNIVILLMESWSADLIESLGGEAGITPNFRKLEEEGLLFTQLYSSGNRSQQGLGSLFAGFPGIPYTTITENPDKFKELPSLSRTLKDHDYYTSFYFGGDLNYGNIRGYLLFNQLDKIVEEKDISDELPRGRLGIHDEYMMDLFANELNQTAQPFFSVLFTLSSHSPYDQPKEHSIAWDGLEAQYVNSAYYSDYALGEFFEKVKKEPWYDSTLFVIIADHSHNSYRNWPVESFNYRKIPMMFLGGALKEEFRGIQLDRISSNMDLPKTLLAQMRINRDAFNWGRDLMNPYSREYAYFELNDGVGWKNQKGEFSYNVQTDHYYSLTMVQNASERDKEELLREGKSYIQVLFQTFIEM